MNTVENTASRLYSTYCAAVGGVAFNGDPLPDWETFRADPAKEKQSAAWIAAAETVATDAKMIDTAVRLRALFGIDVRTSFKADVKETKRNEFWIYGGDHGAPYGPKSSSLSSGATIEEAEAAFTKDREKLAGIDPLNTLREQAAKEGFDLVPAARPLDLATSTNREG